LSNFRTVAEIAARCRVTNMTIRIATQNIWGRTPLWALRKRALARGLGSTDIALLQEVQRRGQASQAHDLARHLGLDFAYFASAGRTLTWREGLGIISRWPAIHVAWEKFPQRRSNVLDRIAPRAVLRVVLDTPLGRLEVYAMHLSLSKDARTRAGKAVAAFARQQRALLPATFAVFGGDFNARSDEPCVQDIKRECGLIDVADGGDPTFPAMLPLLRLDYLLVSPNLRVTRVERRWTAGSDHRGLLANINA
jgi:endonuclease/exonuclease/phosphatase family metal-dependent hydrolase